MGLNVIAVISMLHPGLAAAGLLAGGIPLIIHLINRRRHRRVRWAAMTFLQQAVRRRARRLRLEQWLLLAIRAGMLAALGLALARPFLNSSGLLPVGQARAHRIILLDNSASMGALGAGESSVFEEARKAALALVDSFPPADAVSIVTLAAPASASLGFACFDRREARDKLALLPLTQRATDVAGAFAKAEDILKDSPAAPGNRVVYVMSDMAAAAWSDGGDLKSSAAAAAAQRVAERAALVLAPVGHSAAGNVAVTGLEAGAGAVAVRTPVRFTVEVANRGLTEVRDAALQIRRDQRIERRMALPRLPPGARETLTFLLEFDAPGTYAVAAHLDLTPPDAFALDNERYLSVNVAASTPVLIAGGTQTRAGDQTDTHYLTTALNPWREARGGGFVAPKRISDLELAGEILGDFRVLVLCNVSRLEEAVWRRVLHFVEAGGGLLVFGGDAVDVEHYNRLGFAAGEGVLPGALAAPVSVDPAAERLGFKPDEFRHPALSEFGGAGASGLFAARVEKFLPLTLDGTGHEVLLRYTNGQPAVAARPRGAGLCCVVTTTANMDWTNLPAKGDYVSLVMNLISYLSNPAGRGRNVEVGEPLVRRLSAGDASLPLRVQLPGGATVEAGVSVAPASGAGVSQGFALRFEATEQVGSYRTFVGTGPESGEAVQGFAVNLAAAESDLRRLEEAELSQVIRAPFTYAGTREALSAKAGASAVREVGPELIYVVLGLLLAETWLAMRFGSSR